MVKSILPTVKSVSLMVKWILPTVKRDLLMVKRDLLMVKSISPRVKCNLPTVKSNSPRVKHARRENPPTPRQVVQGWLLRSRRRRGFSPMGNPARPFGKDRLEPTAGRAGNLRRFPLPPQRKRSSLFRPTGRFRLPALPFDSIRGSAKRPTTDNRPLFPFKIILNVAEASGRRANEVGMRDIVINIVPR